MPSLFANCKVKVNKNLCCLPIGNFLPLDEESAMVEELEKTIRTRIRVLLAGMDKTQAWLSAEAGINEGYLSQLMKGEERRWNIDYLQKVALVIGCPVWHLFTAPEEAYSTADREIISAYRRLPNGAKKTAVDEFLGINKEKPTQQTDDPLLKKTS